MLKDRNHKSILMRPLERLSGLPSPYGFFEGLGCMKREARGPKGFRNRVPYPPKEWSINDGVAVETTLGFMGDILDTKGLPACIGPDVTAFFSSCDAVIGNFESIITDLPGHGTSVRHIPQIVDALSSALDPGTTYLSVANNHAGDYPAAILFDSIRLLEERGFHVFGWNDKPCAEIGPAIRVVGATDWSNAPCDTVAMLDETRTTSLIRPDAFNVLFPHWGYELELDPRLSVMKKARAWLDKGFDAIVAHHGHTPRTLYAETRAAGQPASLVADSLGDFVCGFTREWYCYGIVAKIDIGRNSTGSWTTGRVTWEFCETGPDAGTVMTKLRPDLSPEALARMLAKP